MDWPVIFKWTLFSYTCVFKSLVVVYLHYVCILFILTVVYFFVDTIIIFYFIHACQC